MNESSAAMLEDGGIEADLESFYKHLFLIQDLYASGYRMADVGPDENGLVNKLGLFGTLKLALVLQFIVMNAYFSVACNTKVSVRATLK